jgi:hypothetical protein
LAAVTDCCFAGPFQFASPAASVPINAIMRMPVARCCKKCRKALDASDPGEYWDRQPFCHACIRAAGLGDFIGAVPALEETVESGFAESFLRGVQSKVGVEILIAGMVFGMAFLIYLAMHGGGGRVQALLFFFKFTLSFLAILGIPTTIGAALHAPRRRTIRVEHGKLIERTEGWGSTLGIRIQMTALALTPSSWSPIRLSMERNGQIWARPLIEVSTSRHPDARACGLTPILCGYTEPYRRLWAGYFSLRGLHRVGDPFPGFCVMYGPFIGGMAGMSVALVVTMMMGKADWVVPLGALGYLDGLLGGISCAIAFSKTATTLRRWMRSNPLMSAAILIGMAVLCGGQIGGLVGPVQAVGCRIINAVFGLAVWAGLLFAARREETEAATLIG